MNEKVAQSTFDGITSHEAIHLATNEMDTSLMCSLGEDRNRLKTYLVFLGLKHTPLGNTAPSGYEFTGYTDLGEALGFIDNPPRMDKIISNWADFMVDYWLELRNLFKGDCGKVRGYFEPFLVEKEIRVNEEMSGKIDVVFRVPPQMVKVLFNDVKPRELKSDFYLILDYKTGNVPAAVERGENYFRTKDSLQLHFYAYLLSKKSKGEIPLKKIIVGILFLGGHKPHLVLKRANATSVAAVLKKKEKLKQEYDMFKDDADHWKPAWEVYKCEGTLTNPPSPCQFVDICWREHLKDVFVLVKTGKDAVIK